MLLLRSLIIITCLLASTAATGYSADVPVSLELVTERGFPIGGQQRWAQFLKSFGFTNIRIRSARGGDEPRIENRGSDSSPRYIVTGVLTANGRLVLPGVTVRYSQRGELSAWLDKLRRGGGDAVTAPTGLFGLTAKQFSTLHDALKRSVAIRTKDKSAREVLRRLQQTIPIQVDVDSRALQLIPAESKVLDELQGISSGTALAALVRPFGLLVAPTGQGTRTVGLRVTRSVKPEDAWPVGSPLKRGEVPVPPALLKFINVEIVDQPLDDTLNTIHERLKIPFLYDHNALARHEVDLHDTVSMPRKKTFYKKILDVLLFQKLLVAELRIDEAGTPFVWITSAKR